MDAMERYCSCVAGSRILVDDFKVTWNYRFSDPSWAQAEAEFLHKELQEMFEGKGLQVTGACVVTPLMHVQPLEGMPCPCCDLCE
jgi:hypothetical protein